MRVGGGEAELAGDKQNDSLEGVEAWKAASAAFGGLKRAVKGFEKAVGLAGCAQATMSSRWRRAIVAIFFIGSNLERMTQVRQGLGISRTTLICLRSTISRNSSL